MDQQSNYSENGPSANRENPPAVQENPQEVGADEHMAENDEEDTSSFDYGMPDAGPAPVPLANPSLNVINLNDFRNEPTGAGPSLVPQVPNIDVMLRNGAHHESQKIHKQIPIYIVEDHHHVVPFIHGNIRRKFLPVKGNTLIHLDSHPDMLIPKTMPADHAYETARLYEAHDIENWIMPNCYTGIFQHLMWVKPPWSNQIRKTHQKIYIGKCKASATMRLECRENYFISEGLFKLREDMEAIREITLDCLTLGNRLVEAGDDIGQMKQLSELNDKTPTVLDIDLDFFSTRNPFLDLYENAELYTRLRNIFRFNPPSSDSDVDILSAQQTRIGQMDELEILFNHLNEHKSMPLLEDQPPSALYTEVASAVEAIRECYDVNEVNWLSILDAGFTIDDHELPHNISTPDEFNVMFQCFENFLETFLEAPRIITIARSSTDEYTPPHQVDYIQERVLEILNRKFVCAPPVLHYLEMAVEEQQPVVVDNAANVEMEIVSVSSESSALSAPSDELPKSQSGSGPARVAVEMKERSPDTADEADPICDFEESGPSGM